MENRRMIRRRKNAQRRGIANALLILVLAVAVLVLGEQWLHPGKSDDGAVSSVVYGAQTAATEAPPEKQKNLLILVNKDNKLPSDFSADLTYIGEMQVDKAVVDDLKDMRTAAQKDSVFLSIGSAYRSTTEQAQAFNDADQGVAARPGYSEHETGLAIDFSMGGDAGIQAAMWEWLGANAWKYGFILRYPEGKAYITGYNYEPWHYRYVGKTAAKEIYEQGVVLEEYLGVAVATEPAIMRTGAPGGLPLEDSGREGMALEEGEY